MKNIVAYSTFTVKEADQRRGVIDGVASTPEIDRVGDIVRPEGAKFTLPLPLLWQHDDLAPVGNVISAKSSAKGIRIRAQIEKALPDDPPALRFRLEEAFRSVERGLVRGLSIGFTPKKTARLENGGFEFLEWDWHELSLVTIPANHDATIANIKHFSARSGLRRSGLIVPEAQRKAKNAETRNKAMPTNLEKIAMLDAERAELASTAKGINDAANAEQRDLTEDEENEVDEALERIKKIDKDIDRLQQLEAVSKGASRIVRGRTRAEASASRDAAQQEPVRTVEPTIKEEKGLSFARAVLCYGAAHLMKQNPADVAKQYYGDRDPRVELVLRAAVAGGNTGVAAYAGAVATAQDVQNDFLEFLRPMTIVGKFGVNGVPSLRRAPLNSKTNRGTGGTTGYEVGDGEATTLSKAAFDQITLGVREFVGATVISKRNLRFANINLEMAIRDDIAGAISGVKDTKFITSSVAGSVTNGLTAIASAGDTAADVRTDLQKLIEPIEAANLDASQVVLIMNKRLARALSLMRTDFGAVREFPNIEMTGGIVEGYSVITSNYVPAGNVVALHAPSIVYGDEPEIEIDVDPSASVQMDDAPTNNAATGTGASLVSMAQTRSVFITGVHLADWKVGRTNSVAFINDASWNGAISA